MKKEFKVRVEKEQDCYGSMCLDSKDTETQKYIKSKESKQNYAGTISVDVKGKVFQ
jgi:hypothetical protein